MKDTENREDWYKEGEKREESFVDLYGKMLSVAKNPAKILDPTVLDLVHLKDNILCDLKDQSTPFFTAGKKYGIDPQFAVTFNKKDKQRYITLSDLPDIYIYFWVKWREQENFGVSISRMNRVYKIRFNKLLDYLTQDKLHEYERRKIDKRPNAKSSYVVDVRNMELLAENGSSRL
jgi:hypothetical protein